MASFLLDEHISPVVAEQVTRKTSGAALTSMQEWHDGQFLGAMDDVILAAAFEERLTLITFDLSTIKPLMKLWGESGLDHSGVVFIDDKTIANDDYGGLVKAILRFVEAESGADLTNAVRFLSRAN